LTGNELQKPSETDQVSECPPDVEVVAVYSHHVETFAALRLKFDQAKTLSVGALSEVAHRVKYPDFVCVRVKASSIGAGTLQHPYYFRELVYVLLFRFPSNHAVEIPPPLALPANSPLIDAQIARR